MEKTHILIVEDNPADALCLKNDLETSNGWNFATLHAETLAEAKKILKNGYFHAVVLDLGLPDSQGLETFLQIQKSAPSTSVVVLSGLDDETLAHEAVRNGAQDYLLKDKYDRQFLSRSIIYAIHRKQAEEETRRLNEDLEKRIYERTSELTMANEILFVEIADRKNAQAALLESERKYRELVQNANSAIIRWKHDGTLTFFNEQAQVIFGYEPHEVLGKKVSVLLPENGSPGFDLSTLIQDDVDRPQNYENYVSENVCKDGRRVWMVWTNKAMLDEDGNVSEILAVGSDITALKQYREALRESEDQYRAVFDNAAIGIDLLNPDGRIVKVNKALLDMVGYSEDEIRQKTFLDITHPDDREISKRKLESLLKGEVDSYRLEKRYVKKDGSTVWANLWSCSIRDENGGHTGTVGVVEDITERKRAEEALRQSESKYRFLAEHVTDVLWTVDLNLRTTYISPSVESVLGYTVEERLRQDVKDQLTPESLDIVQDKLLKNLRRAGERGIVPEDAVALTLDFVHKNGSVVSMESVMSFIVDETGSPIGIHGLSRDITERKKAEQALRGSEEFNRRLVENAPFGIVYLDGDGMVEYVNPAAKRIAGIPEGQDPVLLGHNILEVQGLQDQQQFQKGLDRLFRGKSLSDLEVPYVSSMGVETVLFGAATPRFSADGAVSGAILMFADISESKKAEELQREAERYKAVADLAGGVAHNFNNLLQIIIGGLELALMDLKTGKLSKLENALRKVLEGSRFGIETVRRLQSFAGIRDRSQRTEKGVFDLSGIIKQALEMSKTWWKTIPEKLGITISLNTKLQDGCFVRGEKNELFEVMLNLIKNATEALPQGGTIDVNAHIEGEQVVFTIEDTGIGISQDNLSRVFNPFFTTKARTGSGLGLASSRKIIDDCGGKIQVKSEEGKGTTFRILLPLAEQSSDAIKRSVQDVTGEAKTILVIDDMEAVLDVLKAGLTRSGHVVVTASSGQQGLDIFSENSIDLVICDLGMPGINGWEVGKRIKSVCDRRHISKTPFVLLTGWGGQSTEADSIAESGVDAVMEKPVNIEQIQEVIRKLIISEPSFQVS